MKIFDILLFANVYKKRLNVTTIRDYVLLKLIPIPYK